MLAVHLVFGKENKEDHSWEEMLNTEFRSYIHRKGSKFKGEWMSEGYMKKKYGEDEFNDMKKKGKLRSRKDAWGDDEYQKMIEVSEEAYQHEHGGQMNYKRKLGAD